MHPSLQKHPNDLLFFALGGANEIGMNFNVYYLHGKFLIVDCGIGFTSDVPGAEIQLPKTGFIEQYKDDIVGMIITHAHEDHVGGVPYLWQYLGCPIYTTKFTAEVIKAKFAEFSVTEEVPIHVIEPGHMINLNPFSFGLPPKGSEVLSLDLF